MKYNSGVMKCSRQMFVNAIFSSDKKLDSFARTFLRKADMQNMWDKCRCIVDEDNICAAIITTYSKREPKVANLQLLHTFSKYRGNGYARLLCELSFAEAEANGAKYYRISAEPSAVGFYKKLDCIFIGKQKSGCQLSMVRIEDLSSDLNDPIINAAVYKKGKGGCVEIF